MLLLLASGPGATEKDKLNSHLESCSACLATVHCCSTRGTVMLCMIQWRSLQPRMHACST